MKRLQEDSEYTFGQALISALQSLIILLCFSVASFYAIRVVWVLIPEPVYWSCIDRNHKFMPGPFVGRYCSCFSDEMKKVGKKRTNIGPNIPFSDLPKEQKNAYRVCNDRLR